MCQQQQGKRKQNAGKQGCKKTAGFDTVKSVLQMCYEAGKAFNEFV